MALHDLDIEAIRKGKKDPKEMKRQLKQIWRKGRNQALKDYVVYPALSGPQWKTTMAANATANFTRNVWSYVIIFCGHFPDGAMHFTEEEIEDETRAEWYLRQILGAANFKGGPLLHIMSGNLGFQIEHHLFPDLPSNRYAEISVKVQALCQKYDIPYTTGPLHQQYGQALRTIMKLSLPNAMTSSDKPEPPGPPVARGRKTDAERPTRRTELGAWSRPAEPGAEGRMTPVLHDLATGAGSPAAPCRGSAAAAVRRWAGRSCSSARPTRWPGTPSTCRRCTSRAPTRLRSGPGADPAWQLVRTSGFEFVRPAKEDLDQEPRFEPNSLL